MKRNILLMLFISLITVSCEKVILPATTITQKCLTLHTSSSEKSELSGMLILYSGDVYRFTGKEMLKDHLPRKENNDYMVINYNIFVSPNQQMVLFDNHYFTSNTNTFIERELLLLSPDGTTKPVAGWEPFAPFIIRGWIGNTYLELITGENAQGTIVLLNPNTGDSRKISLELPELFYEPSGPIWYGLDYALPVLDPTVSRAVYLRESEEMQLALFDIENHKLLWTRDIRDARNEPRWSADGEQMVIAVPPIGVKSFELFSIDKSGKETQLTAIGEKYQNVGMSQIQWSPDNNYIALGLDYDGDEYYSAKIAVLDIQRGKILDYCLGEVLGYPVWSSDSRYLAVGIRDSESYATMLVIFDMKNDYAFTITPAVDAVGWME